ncbi:MAG: BrnA antitoxin family protein [Deltaproteobacteria bacterium]|nr:BrnA antitoxin family protein [Deltaproteobacteria bacterium]
MKKLTIKEKEDFVLKKEYDLSKGIRGRFYIPKKVSTTIRIDDDMILLFKKLATETKIGYQTLINTALREYSRKIRKKAVKAG